MVKKDQPKNFECATKSEEEDPNLSGKPPHAGPKRVFFGDKIDSREFKEGNKVRT
jgi:hypothetical protein